MKRSLLVSRLVPLMILFFSIPDAPSALALSAKFSCGPHGKAGADVDGLIISGIDPKNETDTVQVTAKVQKIKIGKAIYKNLVFKGERPYSARGPYYDLESVSKSKKIKSIFISANPSGEEIGQDEVVTADGSSHKMSCSEQ